MPELISTDVIDYHRALLEGEVAAIRADSDGILAKLDRLDSTRRTVMKVLSSDNTALLTSNLTWPRISHRLYGSVFLELNRHNKALMKDGLSFITDTVLPLCGVSPIDVPHRNAQYTSGSEHFCKETERHFVETLDQINGTSGSIPQPRISVYHDTEGTPLILEKIYDIEMGIALADFTITGSDGGVRLADRGEVHIPAGTIVNIDVPGRIGPDKSVRHNDGIVTYETWEVGDELQLHPLKLSPWVHQDPLDQAIFATEVGFLGKQVDGYDEGRASLISSRSLQDFVAASNMVMSVCGLVMV